MTEARYAWLRRRRPGPGIDWDFLAYWTLTGLFVGIGILVLKGQIETYLPRPDELFSDATLYHQATRAWLDGADPWSIAVGGVRFAGLPTTLLLNLPFAPFGPDVARVFWVVVDVAGWLLLMRRLHLGPWWILFPPFIEGVFPASPDPALAAIAVLGGGAIAALTKPYSLPAIAADRRYGAIAVAVLLAAASVFILPWGRFIDHLPDVLVTLREQSRDVTAWGDPPMMVISTVALLSLGPAMAMRLVVPALWPNAQLHYFVFSARAGAASAAVALALATPGLTAELIALYAVARVIRERVVAAGTFGSP